LSSTDKTERIVPFPSPTEVSFVSDCLYVAQRARLLLLKYGWTQNGLTPGFALDEAIKEAVTQLVSEGVICDPPSAERRTMKKAAIFSEATDLDIYPWPHVVRWNDAPARTAADVFHLLDELIDYEEGSVVAFRLGSSLLDHPQLR
jgi:hypothetical protein